MTTGGTVRDDADATSQPLAPRRFAVRAVGRGRRPRWTTTLARAVVLALAVVERARGDDDVDARDDGTHRHGNHPSTPTLGASFKVEIAHLSITTPASVVGKYDIAIANFGRTLYGASLSGALTYPHDARQRLGCGAGATIDIPESVKAARMAVILLLDRGSCAFTEKVMNGQKAGADAVIIVDDRDEPLLTPDAANDEGTGSYVDNITIPAALARKVDGSKFEAEIARNERVMGTMDWHDVLPHPDERVEWELWAETNDECGHTCQQQNAFMRDFKPIAKSLEQGGYTQFTPHYITWQCIDNPPTTEACKAQCINVGRYCAPDPDADIHAGYSGADIVIDNLRALCAFDVANKSNAPWMWWDYVSDFSDECTMGNGKFAMRSCAEKVAKNIGIDVDAINACMGDTNGDHTNPMLEAQIAAQSPPAGSSRRDIRLLPTILINGERYSGKIARGEVLTALCAGFDQASVPAMCSDAGLMHAECVRGQQGDVTCAADKEGDGKTACKETGSFPYYECACPEGSQSVVGHDGTEKCESVNMCAQAMHDMANCSCDRCVCTNLQHGKFQCKTEAATACDEPLSRAATSQGGCWAKDGFSACVDNIDAKRKASREGGNPDEVPSVVCKCPKGFEGDGTTSCVEIDECKTKCKDSNAKCVNTYGSYNCTCSAGYAATYQPEPVDDWICLSTHRSGGASLVFTSVLMSILGVASASYAFYQYRARSYMDREIRQIMAQYMPLDQHPPDDDDSPYDQPPQRDSAKQNILPTSMELSDF